VLQYNRNRFYDYYVGRFTSHDPQGYIDGINLYEYALCNPVVYSDPYGLLALIPKIKKLDWHFTGGCWPTGSATASIDLGSIKLFKFFVDIDTTLTINGSFGWTDDYKEDCYSEWSPWEWKVETHIKLLPPWKAHSDITLNGYAPDVFVDAILNADVYGKAWFDAGVKYTASIKESINYKTWIESYCRCAKLTYDLDFSGEAKLNVTGSATAAVAVVAAAKALPALIELFKSLPDWVKNSPVPELTK
jgi:hypothetical protein